MRSQAVPQYSDEPEKHDPGKRNKTQREPHRVTVMRLDQPDARLAYVGRDRITNHSQSQYGQKRESDARDGRSARRPRAGWCGGYRTLMISDSEV